jgi:hypothetical protein
MKERLLFQGKQPQLYFSPEPEIESIADKFSLCLSFMIASKK